MDGNAQSVPHQAGPSPSFSSEDPASRWDGGRSPLPAATASASGSAPLHHQPSLATTRSASSASSSSHRSLPNSAAPRTASASSSSSARASASPSRQQPFYSDTVQSPKTRTHQKAAKRLPVYVRIVPKDIWLRIHVSPSQTIGSIKDAALYAANAPDQDPSLSYRFYQDAVNASAHAKIAPVAGHDKVVKHRTYALPRSFLCPPPDLTDVVASVSASLAHTGRSSKSARSSFSRQSRASHAAPPPPVPPLPTFDNAYSPRQAQQALSSASASQQTLQYGSASPHSRTAASPALPLTSTFGTGGGSSSSAKPVSDDAFGSSSAHFIRQISNSTLATTLATSSPSTTSDWEAATSSGSNNAVLGSDASAASVTSLSQSQAQSQAQATNEIAIHLDASLITGDRIAKLEEDLARSRLSQWIARRDFADTNPSTSMIPREANLSVAQVHNSPRSNTSTHPIDPSGMSNNDLAPSLAVTASPSNSSHAYAGTASSPRSDSVHTAAATPPRRPIRLNPGPAPAIFYTQPGACDSVSSLASTGSPSSADLVGTTADDDAMVMQWGTQAEAPLLSDPHPSPPPSSAAAAFAPLSSPLQPSTALLPGSPSSPSSSARPRSRTVTAADVLRSRAARREERANPPPLPPMPHVITSPARNSSLPRPAVKKLVPESSQRRDGPQFDLLELLKESPREDFDDNDDDGDVGFSTVRQRSTKMPTLVTALRKKSLDGSTSAVPPAIATAADDGDQYIAGIRLDEISRGWKDASHPLSSKYAVLSSANGCELDEWKTVAASLVRPFELLEMQWHIPTERVYIPPISLHDTIRVTYASPAVSSSSTSKGLFKQTWGQEADAGPDADALCLEPYFEGWVYVLKGGAVAGKTDKSGKGSAKMGKWKLHWMTVKGWRIDLYRKKPRAGEAVLPVADQVWSLRSVNWVAVDSDHPVPSNAAVPGLEAMPRCSVTLAFSPKSSGAATPPSWMTSPSPGSLSSGEIGATLALRCISHFDHRALSTLLLRAWYRGSASATSWSRSSSSSSSEGVDNWRRKAVFRAIVAGRGGTVAAGRIGKEGRRNARARTRLRPSGWPKEWEDADQWSSESEREEIAPPAELEHALSLQQQQARRDTVTQAKADQSAAQRSGGRKQEVLAGGLYAALSGKTMTSDSGMPSESEVVASSSVPFFPASGSATVRPRHLAQSPSLPHLEPGLMLGGTSAHLNSSRSPATRRRRQSGGSGSASRSPDAADRIPSTSSLRSRSFTGSHPDPKPAARGRSTPGHSSHSSRNVSREASPHPSSGSSSRKGSASGLSGANAYNLSPAIVPGFVDVLPPPSVMLLKKFKASQKAAAQAGSSGWTENETP
ncbi:hypothetical protein EX895_006394 [Sporisorium graminicola]|uniref:Uncharacterized protein n=1 Tax=Sporisorium graminicola TaxID=280036 RepID=A0A4U7KKW1_9BASI|nr:hypothetical protein EX895_006394 [Sporisorium graminicola]TKY84493.1 hypothetical protein EX895_006394 [Sporisorium graminicola]